jgi:hypothetical protein
MEVDKSQVFEAKKDPAAHEIVTTIWDELLALT